MKLIKSHTDATRQGTTVTRYYEDEGVPVEISVHQDPYAQQTFGVVKRWTDSAGYQPILTADPAYVFTTAKVDLGLVADELVEDYQKLLPDTMMENLKPYSDAELALRVFNEEDLYRERHREDLTEILNERYVYTNAQYVELLNQLEAEES
jgi:hypothetical protein